jgi:hypothetical protein
MEATAAETQADPQEAGASFDGATAEGGGAMICIEQQRDVAGLLEWAAGRLDDPDANPVQIRLAGVAARLA